MGLEWNFFRKRTYWKYRPSYMYNLKVYFSELNFRGIPVSYVALSGVPRVPQVPL